jgi:hypothetical protein
VNVREGSWLRENSEIELANGNFVLTSIILKEQKALVMVVGTRQ